MAFDQSTRNLLQRTVAACRNLLAGKWDQPSEGEFTQQLQQIYGINPDGSAAPLSAIAHLSDEELETARILRQTLDHYASGLVAQGKAESDARAESVARIVREQAFTVLNRLAALRLAEERGIVLECVRKGMQSEGFQLFQQSTDNALGGTFESYRAYLSVVFDELAFDLGSLFDRWDPHGLLFPRQAALEAVLAELNGSGTAASRDAVSPETFAGLWREDETIGWIYQYYNDPAERKKMRDESAAPRNSREMAVRNQFFTPRYVVEFLTDNALGRLWYEMTHGETVLRDRCRYLIRRPSEVFLNAGESAPETGGGTDSETGGNLSQEDLLRQTVHIPHRPLKDPREIRMIDPACGSMHFGLYAFDLFTVLYEEAWDMAAKINAEGRSMAELEGTYPAFSSFILHTSSFSSKAAFAREIPRLIIECNLHGVDIDPRAAQIAGLSLWLRAQRAWQDQDLAVSDRPSVRRSHIVCAESMPGEKAFLREFVEQQFPLAERAVFLQFLESIFDRMQLAGEAGSLLQIEEDIRSAIAESKLRWKAPPRVDQTFLFGFDTLKAQQEELTLDLSGITDEAFWEHAEERIYTALRTFAESAGGSYQQRLFADDAARGFAFIDLCRQRYDVALMNPPFGDASLPSRAYIEDTYGDTKGDVYKAFVECFHARLLPAGYLGIISSRTGFFLGQSEDWRTRVVLRLFRPIALADLGMGVLDAMVEVAAYVLRSLSAPEARDLTLSLAPLLEKLVCHRQDRFSLPKWQIARGGLKSYQAVAELKRLELHGFIQSIPGDAIRYTPLWHTVRKVTAPPEPVFPLLVCIRALADNKKDSTLLQAITNPTNSRIFVANPQEFKKIPSVPFSYWVGKRVRDLFTTLASAEADDRRIALGLSTKCDFRFVRVWWEVDPQRVGRDSMWGNYANGGNFSPFYFSYPAVVLAENGFTQLRAYINAKFPYLGGNTGWILHDENDYRSPAIAWPLRTHAFSPSFLPTNYFFSARTYAALIPQEQIPQFLGLFASKTVDFLLKVSLGRSGHPEFVTNVVRALPVPEILTGELTLGRHAVTAWRTKREIGTADPLSHAFELPALLATSDGATLAERTSAWVTRVRTSEETVAAIQAEIDDLAFNLYGLDVADRAALTSTLAPAATGEAEAGEDEEEEAPTADAPALAADLLAYALGCAFGRWDIRYATGELSAPPAPTPFAPIPVSPPGMLQNSAGIPAAPSDVPASYPMRITWPGLLVDDPAHPEDIERRVREVLAVLFPGHAEAIADEACTLLGVKSLREWLRKPAGFFADHLKRYSKSRRQAPIYWPLSTASGSYTLWVYYHRLTPDTLFKCLQDFVEPKLSDVENAIVRLRAMEAAQESGAKDRKQLEEAEILRTELHALRDELAQWAPRWKPNLNDGVQITASPLWKLFRLPKWQKLLEATWKDLDRGTYDWAHLTLTLWPDRVRKKCETDRSLAIAHGLQDLCKIEVPKPKVKRAKKSATKEAPPDA
ncbi:MAG: hypothetical protein JWL59_4358 [Chthoniobacteraceae bacterium]|nr:hypothetical protein [Chthoniobacteraceae bacterium]